MSSTGTTTSAFTRTHAKYVTSKIAGDLERMKSLYGWPSDREITDVVEEMTELLAKGYVKSLELGFSRNDKRVVSVRYEVRSDGTLGDDSAGGIPRGADVSNCDHFNYLTRTSSWFALEQTERDAIEETLPYKRTPAAPPQDGAGHWQQDRTYSSNGTGTVRNTFRPY